MAYLWMLVLLGSPFVAQAAVTTSCKDWCAPFCLDSCKSTLTTPICLGELQCRCICPTVKAACKADWCQETCAKKAGARKFEAKCDEVEQVCKCQFEAEYGPQAKQAVQAVASQPKLVEQTFVADQSLTSHEFKCTQKWCDDYCVSKSNGKQFNASCDEGQSCHCKYELPVGEMGLTKSVDLTAPSNNTAAVHAANVKNTTKAECTQKWCDDYCVTKANGRGYEAKCDSPLSCSCQFSKPSSDMTSDKSGGKQNATSKFQCTHKWCSEYCDSKSNGRKFEATCDESTQSCKCQYAWQPTGTRVMASGGPGTGRK